MYNIIIILNDFKKNICSSNVGDGIDNYEDATDNICLCREGTSS